MKRTVVVITDQSGRVHATFTPSGIPEPGAPTARLVAGPSQLRHEIEFEVPEAMATRAHVDEFHRALEKHIKQNRASTSK